MSIYHYGEGDLAECPHCGEEFELNHFDDVEIDDFDKYYEHVSMCEG